VAARLNRGTEVHLVSVFHYHDVGGKIGDIVLSYSILGLLHGFILKRVGFGFLVFVCQPTDASHHPALNVSSADKTNKIHS
jgi:hypothetical protein